MLEFDPRPAQKEVLRYKEGLMGVSAVPGSGKTWTLSLLAAEIIRRGQLEDDQEVLVVTLVNAAVENFSSRVGNFIKGMGLLPQMGYRVRTLHSLAHNIVSERPSLVNLSEGYQIIDERAASIILEDAVGAWLRVHPTYLDGYLLPDMDEDRRDWVRREQEPNLLRDIALAFIKTAKDLRLSPQDLETRIDRAPASLPLAEMGLAIYKDYQRALAYRGAVDFDDLIRLAIQALELDPDYLERLRYRFPFILEDEAQDSSRLQEEILGVLAGDTGNWVRVGDPNQAIYETFTTADPQFLRDFLAREGVYDLELPTSGRSTRSIIDLANYLIDWTQNEHPVEDLRGALSPPHIQPTSPDDSQPNPEDRLDQVFLVDRRFTPQEEIQAVADSVERWLEDHPDETVAILVPRNFRGFQMVEELRRRKIDPVEILRSGTATRLAAGALGNILKYLSDPKSPTRLARAYEVWRREDREDEVASARLTQVTRLLRKCREVEAFLYPSQGVDWLEALDLDEPASDLREDLEAFRELVRRWQGAAMLPIDQLVLTLAQDLFQDPAELALSHKLALVLKRASVTHGAWQLPELTEELATVARNERRFIGFSEDDLGFDPNQHKGRVLVTTVHKAKGLEWDRVYLMSVNNYDFPSAQVYDSYISEKWFIRDQLDLQSEALAALEVALSDDEFEWYEEGAATRRSRLDYASERLRLLYVGITRARKELIVTWNTGRKGDLHAALPLVALQDFWGRRNLEND